MRSILCFLVVCISLIIPLSFASEKINEQNSKGQDISHLKENTLKSPEKNGEQQTKDKAMANPITLSSRHLETFLESVHNLLWCVKIKVQKF
jgi:hypothetical protein